MSYSEVICKLKDCNQIIAIALGGSRSRKKYQADSDYDLFCVICDDQFDLFRKMFRDFLENIPCILYAAEVFYLENWGYLFKAIDCDHTKYDISIIPKTRISEMSIRSTNIVIKDTNRIYQESVNQANDDSFLNSTLEKQHFIDYVTLFGFERIRFFEAIQKADYWYAVRCLERMKNYLIRCDRIQTEAFPQSRSCPEKGYRDVNDCLKKIYNIDGNLTTLKQTSTKLYELFTTIIQDEDIQMRFQLL